MKIKAKLASLAAVAIIVGTQYPIASNADQPVLQGGDYIVVFDNQANEQAEAAKLRGQGAKVRFTYSSVFKGLAGTFNAAQINALQKNPKVQSIEADGIVTADVTDAAPSWGQDRIDQRNLGLDGYYSYLQNGSGVNAYIVDTGIEFSHSEFEVTSGVSRAVSGYDFIDKDDDASDCNGHGTHVAGTVGGKTYGIAKGVNLIGVRVLDCGGSGSYSTIIAGVDYVATDYKNKGVPSVVNMSLGGGASSLLNNAVTKLISAGVTVVVAAGNSKQDACRFSPASTPNAITVGATTSSDARASYSNYGKCLDIFAPGSNILSAKWKGSSTYMSGTSMASPHVAGVAALYLSANKSATPADVTSAIIGLSTPNIVSSAGNGSPNRLLFTNL